MSKDRGFYKIPKELIEDDIFGKLSIESKLLYSFMLDRTNLSKQNNWIVDGKIYIIYSVKDIQENFKCAEQKAIKIRKELVKNNLIEIKKSGQGNPDKIFVKNFDDVKKMLSENIKNNENHCTRTMNNENQSLRTMKIIDNNNENHCSSTMKNNDLEQCKSLCNKTNIIRLNNKTNIIIKEEEKTTVPIQINYSEIINSYNTQCVSLPSVRDITQRRKNALDQLYIDLRTNNLCTDDNFSMVMDNLFKAAENSDFLTNRNGKRQGGNWCTFDWLCIKDNAIKVLSNKYKNNNDEWRNNDVSKTGRTGNNNGDVSGTITESQKFSRSKAELFRKSKGIQL